MAVTIIGHGSMGSRYHGILESLGHQVNVLSRGDWDSLKGEVAFICNPTFLHLETAIECARRGMHVLIEKPLDCNPDRLDKFLRLEEKNKLTAYVGYPFRHHEALWDLRYYVIQRRPARARMVCHTNLSSWGKPSYSFDEQRGGGVLWELSHELDFAEYLFGEILGIEGEVRRLSLPIDDTAELVLHHERATVEVSLSLCSPVEERYIEFGGSRYRVKPSEQMYVNQVRFFLSRIGQLKEEFQRQVRFWKRLWEFKEGKGWRDSIYLPAK